MQERGQQWGRERGQEWGQERGQEPERAWVRAMELAQELGHALVLELGWGPVLARTGLARPTPMMREPLRPSLQAQVHPHSQMS